MYAHQIKELSLLSLGLGIIKAFVTVCHFPSFHISRKLTVYAIIKELSSLKLLDGPQLQEIKYWMIQIIRAGFPAD